jgi:ParB family chromosome partitioning protein
MNGSLQTVAIDDVVVREQVRQQFDEESIKSLAESIRESGLQQPLLVQNDNGVLVLIDGERRLRATRLLGATKIAVFVLGDPVSIAEAVERQLACNLQRADLNIVERAKGISLLMKQSGMTVEGVAKKLGSTAGQITKSLSVLKLPAELQSEVVAGRLPGDSAYQLSRVEDPKHQAALAAEVLGKRLTRDELTRKLKRIGRKDAARRNGPSRITAILGEGRSLTLAGKGLSLDSAIEWLEQFLARAKRAKAQSLSLETFARAMKDQAAKGAAS